MRAPSLKNGSILQMKLRFRVNQAEAFRRGLDVPKSIVSVDVTPSEIPQDVRNLIADRMVGIDLAQLGWSHSDNSPYKKYELGQPVLIQASEPTFEALLDAIREDERKLEKDRQYKLAALSAADFLPPVHSHRSSEAVSTEDEF